MYNNRFFSDNNIIPQEVQCLFCTTFPEHLDILVETIMLETILTDEGHLDLNALVCNKEYDAIKNVCCRSAAAFQVITNKLASKMIISTGKIDYKRTQPFLTRFLDDLQSSMVRSAFLRLYSNNLYNYVLLLSEPIPAQNDIIQHILKTLKIANFKDFIILITHFPKYLHLE